MNYDRILNENYYVRNSDLQNITEDERRAGRARMSTGGARYRSNVHGRTHSMFESRSRRRRFYEGVGGYFLAIEDESLSKPTICYMGAETDPEDLEDFDDLPLDSDEVECFASRHEAAMAAASVLEFSYPGLSVSIEEK